MGVREGETTKGDRGEGGKVKRAHLEVPSVWFPDGFIPVGGPVGHALHILDGELGRDDTRPVLGVVVPTHNTTTTITS